MNEPNKPTIVTRPFFAKVCPLPDAPVADVSDLYGSLSDEEADEMIREIEEAFEQIDGE